MSKSFPNLSRLMSLTEATAPTAKHIQSFFGRDMSDEQAKEAFDIIRSAGTSPVRWPRVSSQSKALDRLDKLIDGHGVEAVNGSGGDAVALYVNTGDTYNATFLLDFDSGEILLTTLGDWVEEYEKENGPLP